MAGRWFYLDLVTMIPSWDSVHPLVVHLPLGALVVVPLLVLLAAGSRRHRTPYTLAAMVVLTVGTLGLVLAMVSGQTAAALAVERYPEAREAIRAHSGWASFAVVVFSLLTLLLAMLTFVPLLFERKHRSSRLVPLYTVFLLLYAAALVPVAFAGLTGGQLVHEHGVRALPADADWPSEEAPTDAGEEESEAEAPEAEPTSEVEATAEEDAPAAPDAEED